MPLLETIRAKAGAALLDIVHPEWAKKIDTDKLDLSNCQVCVLGQLYGDYEVGAAKLFAMADHTNGHFQFTERDSVCERAGFVAPKTLLTPKYGTGGFYSRLTKAWRREIEKRQNA